MDPTYSIVDHHMSDVWVIIKMFDIPLVVELIVDCCIDRWRKNVGDPVLVEDPSVKGPSKNSNGT